MKNQIKQISLVALVLGILATAYSVNGIRHESTQGSPYSNDNIHQWACDTAIRYDEAHGGKIMGCYDICWTLGNGKKLPNGDFTAVHMISDEYSYELQNACAITLSGAEW